MVGVDFSEDVRGPSVETVRVGAMFESGEPTIHSALSTNTEMDFRRVYRRFEKYTYLLSFLG